MRFSTMMVVAALFGLDSMAADDAGWTSLFDGKTLKGWTDLRGGDPKGWTVEDGVLHYTAPKDLRGSQNIYTAKEYANFILQLEWKIVPRGNSGIKYRMNWYGGAYLGPEYQILGEAVPAKSSRRRNPKDSTGSIYALIGVNPETQRLKPAGEWNQTRIVARGSHLEHWLNGQKVAEVDVTSEKFKKAVEASKFRNRENFARNRAGRIMLQDHGHQIWFRNIRIKVLPDPGES